MKRFWSFLLAAAMAASLLVVPAGAAGAVRFSDVTDQDTVMAVESLRLMGVLDGYSDGSFRPGAALNRAQFCKMAVYAMNGEEELGLYNTVTIFPDAKPSHWASAYINMASRKGVIAGFPDGNFHPERSVTVGQAVTILLRMLGYKDENIGGVWPASYMAVGATVGLTDGVGSDGSAALTRGMAARLFLNLLRADMKEGGSYLASIGATVRAGEVLVTSSAIGPDGLDTAMQLASTGDTTYQMASGKASNGALNGRRGTLVLNKSGKVITFVPDAVSESVTITVASAKATQIAAINGGTYTVTGSTKTYYNGDEKSWSEVYSWVSAGSSVTLYLNAGGGVDYIFVGGGSASSAAVVVYSNESTAGFADLTGGVTGYKIYKNGVLAGIKDMRRYDVATFSTATNTIRVCDTRITGYYEDCSPNPEEPSEITLLGHSFPVLATARETVSKFKPGDQMTLLLTEDNQVAGAVAARGDVASNNAVGIARSGGTVDLLCGITVKGTLSQSNAEDLEGQLVRVSSSGKGKITITRLSGGVSGNLDVVNRTLGSRKLADNVMVFEVGGNGAEAISLSQLTSATIPSSQIAYVRANWDNKIDLIVLGSTVGSVFYYGRAIFTDKEDPGSADPHNNLIGIDAPRNALEPIKTNYRVNNGEYIGISLSGSGNNRRIAALVKLMEVKDVPNTAWSGETAVVVGGRSYTIPSEIMCYNRDTRNWVSLGEAHAYAEKCNLYIHNGVVRAIEVGH